MISKQLILSQMGLMLGWAFPGRSQLGVTNLDLTCLKEIDFLSALRSSVNIGVYTPVKGNTLSFAQNLKGLWVLSPHYSFLSYLMKQNVCPLPPLGSHLKLHLTVLEVSSVTSNPTKW